MNKTTYAKCQQTETEPQDTKIDIVDEEAINQVDETSFSSSTVSINEKKETLYFNTTKSSCCNCVIPPRVIIAILIGFKIMSIVDIITDILTIILYYTSSNRWWGTFALLIFIYSCRMYSILLSSLRKAMYWETAVMKDEKILYGPCTNVTVNDCLPFFSGARYRAATHIDFGKQSYVRGICCTPIILIICILKSVLFELYHLLLVPYTLYWIGWNLLKCIYGYILDFIAGKQQQEKEKNVFELRMVMMTVCESLFETIPQLMLQIYVATKTNTYKSTGTQVLFTISITCAIIGLIRGLFVCCMDWKLLSKLGYIKNV